MTKSKIKAITVKVKKVEEGVADLVNWTLYAVPKAGASNPFWGRIYAPFKADTYRCWYGYPQGNSYTTSEVEINKGEAHDFEQKSLIAPSSYPFDSGVFAAHKLPDGNFTWDSGLYVTSHSADQQAGKTALPWLWTHGLYMATEGSQQTINWIVRNYGADGNIYVGLWDDTDEKWLDAMINWEWLKADATRTGSFTFPFHSNHTLAVISYYWYNDKSHIYNEYVWLTR